MDGWVTWLFCGLVGMPVDCQEDGWINVYYIDHIQEIRVR